MESNSANGWIGDTVFGQIGEEEKRAMSKAKKLAPIHPGEVLYQDFMKPTATSINRLALDLHVPVTRVAEIVKGERSITADTALRLARHLRTTAAFWMNLQARYDLDVAEDRKLAQIEREVQPRAAG
jgi:antitoxin HigA-1